MSVAVDGETAARRWAKTWERGWPTADVEAISALYAEDAVFFSEPFRAQQAVREYVSWAFSHQMDAECRFGFPIVQGPRAAVDWWAVVTSRDGSLETLVGTSLLRFRDDGLVVEQRDVWASAPGRHVLATWARS